MKKLFFILFVLIHLLNPFVFAEKPVTLSKLMKADSIVVDDRHIYITENTTIYIYSLEDSQLKKTFGKHGEGPQEFMGQVNVILQPDGLLVNSPGKISYYTKDGEFIKELKTGLGNMNFWPLEKGFVGRGSIQDNQVFYVTVNLFDSHLKKGKELFRMESALQGESNKIEFLKQTFAYRTYRNKIFIVGKKGFIIDVLDRAGKHLFSIAQSYERLKFTSEDEKKMRKVLKTLYGSMYEGLKHRIVFPRYFPEIEDFIIVDNKVYVFTYRTENEKVEFFIFDIGGKLLKRIFVPFLNQRPMLPYPFSVKGGKLYQVVEGEDEEWELYISPIGID